MEDLILQKLGANFFGFESIDHMGKHHYHPLVARGNGDLSLTMDGISFTQWMTHKKYTIPLDRITRIEIRPWHNLKMKWPGKVLRIHYKEENNTKIFGIRLGGNLGLTKGWHDDAYLWKEKIEALIKE